MFLIISYAVDGLHQVYKSRLVVVDLMQRDSQRLKQQVRGLVDNLMVWEPSSFAASRVNDLQPFWIIV